MSKLGLWSVNWLASHFHHQGVHLALRSILQEDSYCTFLTSYTVSNKLTCEMDYRTTESNQFNDEFQINELPEFWEFCCMWPPYCLFSLCVSGILFALLARSRRAKGFLFSSGPCALRGFSCQWRDFKTADVLKSGLKLTKLNKARVCPG